MGRKPLPDKEKRTKRVPVLMTEEDRETLAAAAAKERESLSTYLVKAGHQRAGTVQPKGGG